MNKDKFIIRGGNTLCGRLKVQTSKNATLPILTASLMSGGRVEIKDYPHIIDVENMCAILKALNVDVEKTFDTIFLDPQNANNDNMDFELMRTMRSSIFLLGSMLARFKRATITQPGGCKIGKRSIDIHLSSLKKMGVKIVELGEYIFLDATKAHNAKIKLKMPSVGATENLIQFACLTPGKTVLKNVAREPEIVDLCKFLKSMGAKIYGEGTSIITIFGVNKLCGTHYTPIGDRIVAGTLMVATAIAGGHVRLTNAVPNQNANLIEKLRRIGCQIEIENDILTITRTGGLVSCGEIATGFYPDFPTDMQSQMLALSCFVDGETDVYENVFENRLLTAHELNKMGANISVLTSTHAKVKGGCRLVGANVKALDLRGGASLVLAGLGASGVTTVTDVHYIDRGYVGLETMLTALGADVRRE